MKAIRVLLVILLVVCLGIKLFFPIYLQLAPDLPGIAVILFLLIIIIINNRITRLVALLFCAYGIICYLLSFTGMQIPGAVAFTSPLSSLFFGGRHDNLFRTLLDLFPLLFYTGLAAALLSESGKKLYKVTKNEN